jgi:hypothetical protein
MDSFSIVSLQEYMMGLVHLFQKTTIAVAYSACFLD